MAMITWAVCLSAYFGAFAYTRKGDRRFLWGAAAVLIAAIGSWIVVNKTVDIRFAMVLIDYVILFAVGMVFGRIGGTVSSKQRKR